MGSREDPFAIDDGATTAEATFEEQRNLVGKLMAIGELASDDFSARRWHCYRCCNYDGQCHRKGYQGGHHEVFVRCESVG